jgi:hypothetical protein
MVIRVGITSLFSCHGHQSATIIPNHSDPTVLVIAANLALSITFLKIFAWPSTKVETHSHDFAWQL